LDPQYERTRQLVQFINDWGGVILVAVGFIGFLIGRFILSIRKGMKAVRTDIAQVKVQVPQQIQSAVSAPLSRVEEQMAEYVQAGNFYREQMKELYERTLEELKRTQASLRISEQTTNDLKEFINDQFQERAAGVKREGELMQRVRELEVEVRDLRDAQTARTAANVERDKHIEQLQHDLKLAREDVLKAQQSLDNARRDLDKQRQENEQLRAELNAERAKTATLQQQVETLMAEVESLKRQLSEQRGAALGQSARAALGDILKAAASVQVDSQMRADLAESIEQAEKPVPGAVKLESIPISERPGGNPGFIGNPADGD
jgi:chromosome segregation ATPase